MQGTPKAIEIKGIVRNATVIGAQDGQAEDLINLRFMDGSWRASGDGRLVHTMSGTQYSQLYVHTNVYHHLLGVNNGTLYWFAEIGTDGVSFYPLDNTTSRTNWPSDMQNLPTAPVAVTTVVGELTIEQTGHLLTIIDGVDDFEYVMFKKDGNIYRNIELDVNGKPNDRTLYPYGHIFFNLRRDSDAYETEEYDVSGTNEQIAEICNDKRIVLQRNVSKKNKFSRPFLAIGALQVYDGSFMYASAPQLLFPSQNAAPYYKNYYNKAQGVPNKIVTSADIYEAPGSYIITAAAGSTGVNSTGIAVAYNDPPYCAAGFDHTNSYVSKMTGQVVAFDLVCSVEKIDKFLQDNKDLFQAFCIFITPEQELYKNENGTITDLYGGVTMTNWSAKIHNPEVYSYDEVRYGLMHSNFYLLKRYTPSTIHELSSNHIVDLSHVEDNEIVDLIDMGLGKQILDIEAAARQSFIPKVVYNYNNKLHIANYTARQFDGYPIDIFCLNNHNVGKTNIRYDDYINDVIPQLANNYSYVFQWDKKRYYFIDPDIGDNINYGTYEDPDMYTPYPDGVADAVSRLKEKGHIMLFITVDVETEDGTQKVSRYVEAYDTSGSVDWTPRFVEDLSPILSFPDNRAKKMTIGFMHVTSAYYGTAYLYTKEFALTPHPYLNFACYVKDDLTPNKISDMTRHEVNWKASSPMDRTGTIDLQEHQGILQVYLKGTEGEDYEVKSYGPYGVPQNQFDTEYFPNGLKVAKTENPMFFPVENTYRVGSAEILALISNTIAVGTGQTGAAPLYVFCKDGVYALFVDASGQMTYSNSRVLARDVCNNPRSVTPIDAGVVFTTDRGLMMIAGEQVEEIGQPAEGDVLQYVDSTKVDYSKYAFDALTKIAGLPSSLCDTTDFLTYLQGAIVNYNHNMRELIVTNPNKSYSYVLDREGNWSRRDYTAAEYVNNYPTSYRVTSGGQFYKLDDEGDANTSLEHRKEADNQIFYLSNVIKLDSIGFKQAYRFVVRGYFEGVPCAKGTINGVDVYIYDKGARLIKNANFGDIIRLQYKLSWGVVRWVNADSGFPTMIRIVNQFTGEDITDTIVSADAEVIYNVTRSTTPIACVVEGSYDGRKFAPLGLNRKSGKFTNIGCHVSHTDVRFYRVILCGQVTGKTRIDYMELSADGSVLNTKIR